MKSFFCAALALASVAAGVGADELKPAPPPASPSPAAQQSVLEGYRRYEAPPAIAWRQANEAAAALGGHAGQIRGKPAIPARDRGVPQESQRGARR
ncbi:MAG: hypothetical protein EPO27_04515 [Betaproteobacteria bacterium]|nr:MAG: hypothetical protein EPO27_04515 [Betaproteobacteria bacterium]